MNCPAAPVRDHSYRRRRNAPRVCAERLAVVLVELPGPAVAVDADRRAAGPASRPCAGRRAGGRRARRERTKIGMDSRRHGKRDRLPARVAPARPEVEPLARGQVDLALGRALAQHRRHQQVGPEQELVLPPVDAAVLRVLEQQRAEGGDAGAVRLLHHVVDVRQQLVAQLDGAAVQLLVAQAVGPRLLVGGAEGRVHAHERIEDAHLQPAREQLRRRARPRSRRCPRPGTRSRTGPCSRTWGWCRAWPTSRDTLSPGQIAE